MDLQKPRSALHLYCIDPFVLYVRCRTRQNKLFPVIWNVARYRIANDERRSATCCNYFYIVVTNKRVSVSACEPACPRVARCRCAHAGSSLGHTRRPCIPPRSINTQQVRQGAARARGAGHPPQQRPADLSGPTPYRLRGLPLRCAASIVLRDAFSVSCLVGSPPRAPRPVPSPAHCPPGPAGRPTAGPDGAPLLLASLSICCPTRICWIVQIKCTICMEMYWGIVT